MSVRHAEAIVWLLSPVSFVSGATLVGETGLAWKQTSIQGGRA